jgi:hypothetical protein
LQVRTKRRQKADAGAKSPEKVPNCVPETFRGLKKPPDPGPKMRRAAVATAAQKSQRECQVSNPQILAKELAKSNQTGGLFSFRFPQRACPRFNSDGISLN